MRALLLIVGLAFAAVVWAAPAPDALPARIDLAQRADLLRDPSQRLTPDGAAAAVGWQALNGNLNVGFTADVVWLRIGLDGVAPGRYVLELTHVHHDDVRLYTRASAESAWRERVAGEYVPAAAREIDYRHAAFFVDVPESGAAPLYLRIASRSSILARLTLWEPETFHRAVRGETLWYGLYLGIYVAIVISHLFFWHWTRERIGGWYVVYVAMHCLVTWMSVGYFQQYVALPIPWYDHLQALLLCGLIWVVTRFATLLMELSRLMPRTGSVLLRCSGLVAATCMMLAIGVRYSLGMVPAQIYTLFLCVVLVALPLWLWLRGERTAGFFALAFGVFMAGVFVRFLTTLGLLATSIVTEYSYQVGSIIHMLLMSLWITGRYNAMKQKVIAAQREALDTKSTLAQRLENDVAERTRSLVDEIVRREALERSLREALDVEKQARQEQRDFVAMVSHEFRTPLAIIDTCAQRIARHADAEPAATRERCDNVREATRRMTRLIDEFLSLDRIDGDRRTLMLAAVDPRRLIETAVAGWAPGSVEPHGDNLPAAIDCDEELLGIALNNLIANALRHSPEGVPVRLDACGRDDGGIDIVVVDRGGGIAADEIPKLFQKYFRGRNVQDKPGAGLGLYLVDRIVRQHGGTVTVDSVAGYGSRFVVTLPGKDDAP